MVARYVVGIDLGTTNTACAYVETQRGRAIEVFAAPQLTALGRVEPRETLPSFVYLAGAHDVPAGSLDVPWAADRDFCVGWLAREHGAKVPGRLVSSAKSWICHGAVDREASILPWGGGDDVRKISPVAASAAYLAHLRAAWDEVMGAPLAEQEIVLTVPASFDAVARELTMKAADEAGLSGPRLLEEPQAAYYAWLARHETQWQTRVRSHPLVLVVDVGGGTTDFSLVAAELGRSELGLARVAVGDHLLLGGDNMDIALARQVEEGLGTERLDAQRFHALVAECRGAKERILDDPDQAAVPVTVAGRGGKVIGGALTATVERGRVLETVLAGFFPEIGPDERPSRAAGTGIREFGLPYASDAAITRHLADFLARQRDAAGAEGPLVRPDAILFNGGVCEPAAVRDRVADIVGRWHAPDGSWRPVVLDSESLQLAVARGAAYYGLARRGDGVRIGSGTARTYYLGLEEVGGERQVLCVVPRGMDEGETMPIDREFELTTNRAVSFPLFTATDRTGEQAGDVRTVAADELTSLAPIRTVLRYGRKLEERAIPVQLEATLTEIGTLEIWCAARTSEHRWRLEFRVRVSDDGESAGEVAGMVLPSERVRAADDAIAAVFEGGADPVALMRVLEERLDAARDAWPLATIRTLWDRLWAGEPGRGRSERHEARWLNLAGFLLRPGFGDAADELRIGRLWRVLGHELRFPKAAQCRAELWNLWKRVAGGLDASKQQHLHKRVTHPLLRRGKPTGPKPGPQEVREMWQAIGSCERLDAKHRTELAEAAARSVARGKASDQELWALERLAARVPVYGPLNCVVGRDAAAAIARQLLGAKRWSRPEAYAFALAQIARRSGDRERDLDPDLAEEIAVALETRGESPRAARLVREIVELEAREQARILDESLPAGLRLRA
jgi:molecular chaperone DnaK (HSP70)